MCIRDRPYTEPYTEPYGGPSGAPAGSPAPAPYGAGLPRAVGAPPPYAALPPYTAPSFGPAGRPPPRRGLSAWAIVAIVLGSFLAVSILAAGCGAGQLRPVRLCRSGHRCRA